MSDETEATVLGDETVDTIYLLQMMQRWAELEAEWATIKCMESLSDNTEGTEDWYAAAKFYSSMAEALSGAHRVNHDPGDEHG